MTKPAPYPSDTRAKGWRFELDVERIKTSDTWALASPAMRPWLLMIWMTAWDQKICGSLPDDDELIAAHIGMDLETFQSNRRILLRGWWLADDGRLYHDTLVERVLELLAKRGKEAQRKAEYRAKMSMSHGTTAGQPHDSHGSDDTRTRTRTSTSKSTPIGVDKTPRSRAAPAMPCPDGVQADTWADYLAVRKAKKAPMTPTALDGVRSQALLAGLTLQEALEVCCARGWAGFKAEWVAKAVPQDTHVNRQVAQERRNRSVAAEWLAAMQTEGEAHEDV